MKRYPPRFEPRDLRGTRETPVLGYRGAEMPRYRGPQAHRRGLYINERRANAVVVGGFVGIVLTVVAWMLGAPQSRGPGASALSPLLFPMALLVPHRGSLGELWSFVLAVVQFPVYGAVIGYYTTVNDRALRIASMVVLLTHLLAFVVAACLG